MRHCLLPVRPAGESGLGKTTFIQNLTSSFRVVNGGRVQDGSCTTLSQFQADPDSLRTVLEPMDIPESSRRLMISIQVGDACENYLENGETSERYADECVAGC